MRGSEVSLTNPTAGKAGMILGRLEQIVGAGCIGFGGMNFLSSSGYQQESTEKLMMLGLANVVVGQGIYWIGKVKHWYYN